MMLQGDREAELGLPISPLCDRQNTLVAESQIGTYVGLCVVSVAINANS